MIEVKPVVGYEGLYLVDTMGNVISMPKYQGRYLHNKYVILNQKQTKNGYMTVALSDGSGQRDFFVHRLVAIAFLPNPDNLPEVNHKNGMKQDNRLENLEWVSRSDNMKHALAHDLGGTKTRLLSNLEKMNYFTEYVKVILERDGEVHEFTSTKEAGAFLGTHRDNVSNAIKKKGRVAGWLAFGERRANGEG